LLESTKLYSTSSALLLLDVLFEMAADKIPAKRNIVTLVLLCQCIIKILVVLALLPLIVVVLVPVNNESRTVLALSFGGYCARCDTHHVLPTTDEATREAHDLRDRMIRSGRIDIDELPVEKQKQLLSFSSGKKDEDKENGENLSILCADNQQNDDDDSCFDTNLDPLLATERLYERRGKMFGVLVCEAPRNSNNNNSAITTLDSTTLGSESNPNHPHPPSTIRHHQGDVVILKAYAGKLGGQWNLPGWAPLVGKVPESIPEFLRRSAEVTELFEEVDRLSQEKERTDTDESSTAIAQQIKELIKERSRLSTLCIEELRRHQVLNNFKGIRMPIQEAFAKGPTKLPGGTGDCAAPKLIAKAIELGLTPTGICEIFVGATGGMSTTKGDGEFYDACEPRCQQIAGHMLCGLKTKSEETKE
jgi:hypothetical protein